MSPWVFVIFDGGRSEQQRADEITDWLQATFDTEMYNCWHSFPNVLIRVHTEEAAAIFKMRWL